MLRKRYGFFAAIALGTVFVSGFAAAGPCDTCNQPAPPPAARNFCAIMNAVKVSLNDTGPSGLAWIKGLLGDQAALLDQFDCTIADLNGGLDGDDNLTPNLMLDGEFELRVVYELMLNPGTYAGLATGIMPGQIQTGVDVAAIEAGFTNNFQRLYTDTMDQTVKLLLPSLWGTLQSGMADVIKLFSVPVGTTVTINGIVFTAHADTTTPANREFSIAGDDTADAAALNGLINDATYGVTAVKGTVSGNEIALTITAATISSIDESASDPSVQVEPGTDIPFLSTALRDNMSAFFPNVMTVLAGYATFGDDPSVEVAIKIATLLKLCDLVEPGSCVIGDVIMDPFLYDRFAPFLASDGDADGDGLTNRQEYDLYADVKGSQEYIDAVLNPAIPGSGEGEGEGEGQKVGSLQVPWFVDTAPAASGFPPSTAGMVTWIGLNNFTSANIEATVEYYNAEGTILGPFVPDNVFEIISGGMQFRPVVHDAAFEGAGLVVPNRPVSPDEMTPIPGTGGVIDTKKNGSLMVTYLGDPEDVGLGMARAFTFGLPAGGTSSSVSGQGGPPMQPVSSLVLPYFDDSNPAGAGFPALSSSGVTSIVMVRNHGEDVVVCGIEYWEPDGTAVGPYAPYNSFTIDPKSTLAFRPVAYDPAGTPGGQESGQGVWVPNKPQPGSTGA